MKLHHLFEESGHTCKIERREPSDEDWFRRNRKRCEACDEEYDRQLDAEFIQDLEAEPEEDAPEAVLGQEIAKVEPGISTPDWIKQLAAQDPRRHHQAGQFGTGSPEAIKPEDEPIEALLKLHRDYNIPVDPVTGLAKRADVRSRCGFGHTCHSSPGRHPAWQYPMPDPMRTEPRAPGEKRKPTYRFNRAFEYDPKDIRKWPVSGLSGFKPKSKFKDYVESKLSCPVCRGDEPGCSNSVSQQYGVPKPYCDEHLEESPYIRNLQARLEAEPGLFPKGREPDDAPLVQQWEREQERELLFQSGTRVWRGSTAKNMMVGTLLDFDADTPTRDPRTKKPATHVVQWDDGTKSAIDPARLKVWGPHVKGYREWSQKYPQ
jgi:hypothetical protein